jgi:ABC-type transport system substrate-binding protein
MKKRAWLVSAVVMAVIAAGCAKSTSTGGTTSTTAAGTTTTLVPQNGGTLGVGLDAETDGWDPVTSEWAAAGYFVAETFFDPLCAYDSAGVPVPYLAKSVTHSANYKVWTIGLRSGIKFSKGSPSMPPPSLCSSPSGRPRPSSGRHCFPWSRPPSSTT